MASFTDQISNFNPYVQQLPVETMAQVGMQKQAQFDAGVQKVQGYIDNIAGLDVYKPEDREVLQSKLNELGNNLKIVAAGDFSNAQLVNSVGGMATSIVKDPVIKNAVSSTARYRAELQRLQKDIDSGKASPDNTAKFYKDANKWISDGKAGSLYTGSYKPHFDVMKFFKEQFDAVKPHNWSSDKIFEYDENGNIKYDVVKDKKGNIVKKTPVLSPYMLREEYEGRLPQEVKSTIDAIFSDPRVREQLQITGEYNLANVDGEGLVGLINGQRDSQLISYEDLKHELGLQKNLEKDENKKKEIDAQIEKVSKKIEDVTKSYNTLAEQALTDPDSIRGKLYTDSMTDTISQMYGSVSKSVKAMDNPGYEMRFKELQEANRIAEFNADQRYKYIALAQAASEKQKDRDAAKELALIGLAKGKGGKGAGVGDNALGNVWERAENASDIDFLNEFDSKLSNAAATMTASGNSLVWDSVLATVPKNMTMLSNYMNNGKTKEEAIDLIIKNTAAKANQTPTEFLNYWTNRIIQKVNTTGKIDPNLQDAYSTYKRASKTFSDLNNQNKIYDEQVVKQTNNDIVGKINSLNIKPITVKYQGKDYQVSKEDLSDLAIYARGYQSLGGVFEGVETNKQTKQAEQRLINKGKGFLLDTVLDRFAGGPTSIAAREIKAIGKGIKSLFTGESPYIQDAKGNSPITRTDWSKSEFGKALKQVYDIVSTNDASKAREIKAGLVRAKGFINPNLKSNLLTGENKVDQQTLNTLRNYASEYKNSGKNLAGKEQISNILSALAGDVKDLSMESLITKGSSGEPVVSVRVKNFATGKEGTMILANDEALNVGVDVSTAYEPEFITNIKNKIKFSPRSATSAGAVNDLETYRTGDAYFDGSDDFPLMKDSPYDVKGNILYSDATGLYYGFIYGKNKLTGKEGLMSTDYFTDLSDLVGRMKTTPPQFIQNILK